MSANTTKDTWHGGAAPTRWHGVPADGVNPAGVIGPRTTYQDFGTPMKESPLTIDVSDIAKFISMVPFPSTVVPGDSYNVSWTFQNVGTTDWVSSTPGNVGYYLDIVTSDASGPNPWGTIFIAPGVTVMPGQTHVFSALITVPLTALSPTRLYAYMTHEPTVGFPYHFPQASTVQTLLTGVVVPTDDAIYVSQDPITLTTPGASQVINVVMQNTGGTTWDASYFLVPILGFELVPLSPAAPSTAPGNQASFAVTVVAPSAPGPYSVMFQMAHAGAYFGETTPAQTITVAATSCQVIAAPVVVNDGIPQPQSGSYAYSYALAYFADYARTILVATTGVTVLPNCPDYGVDPLNTFAVIDVAPLAGATRVSIYRTSSTVPYGPMATTGVIDTGAVFPGLYQINDQALWGDGAALPACSSFIAPLAPIVIPNILTNFALDGSEGGVVVGGDLVLDYTNAVYPLNQSGWPTADVSRTTRYAVDGQTVMVTIYGIDGHGANVGQTATTATEPAGFGVGNCMWKIRKMVFSPSGPGRISVGWGAALQLQEPYKTAADATGFEDGYLEHIYQDGREMLPSTLANTPIGGTRKRASIQTYPGATERTGKIQFDLGLDGRTHYEAVYVVDCIDKHTSNNWDAGVANGSIVVLEP